MKRYSQGIFQGGPAMFEQPDGVYVKHEDACKLLRADELENVAFNFERAILFGDSGLAPATSEVACWKVALLDLKKIINAGKRPEDSHGLAGVPGGTKK